MKGPQDFTRRLLSLLELCKPSTRIGLLAGSGLSQEQCHCSEGLRAVVAGIRREHDFQVICLWPLRGGLAGFHHWMHSIGVRGRGKYKSWHVLLAQLCVPGKGTRALWISEFRFSDWHEGLGPESRPPDLMPWDSMVLLYALRRLSENSFYDQSMTQFCSPSLRPPPGPPPSLLAWISDCSGLRPDPSLSLLPSTAHS